MLEHSCIQPLFTRLSVTHPQAFQSQAKLHGLGTLTLATQPYYKIEKALDHRHKTLTTQGVRHCGSTCNRLFLFIQKRPPSSV